MLFGKALLQTYVLRVQIDVNELLTGCIGIRRIKDAKIWHSCFTWLRQCMRVARTR